MDLIFEFEFVCLIYFFFGFIIVTGHPHFFNQLSCGLDVVSMVGEWLTATANINMFTYEIAPVFILMENVVLTKMREIIGWDSGDSILAPGGSISNLYAFLAARHKMFPNYKEHGAKCLPGELVMFTSDQSHYSVKSCAAVSGLGTDNCIIVQSDEIGRMIPSELERAIIEQKNVGKIPFFVSATAGTTVLGAFDPINEIADICDKHGLWLHIDVSIQFFNFSIFHSINKSECMIRIVLLYNCNISIFQIKIKLKKYE